MNDMWRVLLICLGIFGLATQAGADGGALRQLNSNDQGRGWEAVGRLDLGGSGFCTGTLIAPDLVLTAAHCLFDRTNGQRLDTSRIEFLAGWRNGRAEAYRQIDRAVLHPDYVYEAKVQANRVRSDLALLRLSQPIRTSSVLPFATDIWRHGDAQLGVVSYAHDRADAPALQEQCNVMGRQSGVLVMSCSVDFGSSGAPVFRLRDGQAMIVSVVSAKAEMDGNPVALGTDLAGGLSALMEAMQAGTRRFPAATSGGLVFSSGDERNDTGAKFVRP